MVSSIDIYDIKQSDAEAPALDILKNVEYPFILSGPLWPGVVLSDRVLSTGQIELFDI